MWSALSVRQTLNSFSSTVAWQHFEYKSVSLSWQSSCLCAPGQDPHVWQYVCQSVNWANNSITLGVQSQVLCLVLPAPEHR